MADAETEPSTATSMTRQERELEDQIDIEEEDDLEDEDEEMPLFDLEGLIRKLRRKPEFPEEDVECGTQCPKKSYKGWSAPIAQRLSIPAISAIDILKRTIPFPPGYVPPLAIPSWHFFPLERKIPYLHAATGIIYYSRGKLGESLLRPRPIFSSRDPLNYERVIKSPYSVLHDPNVKPLFRTPYFHDWLLQLGVINENDDVICTLKEFNEFRDYLRTVWCDYVAKEVEAADNFLKSQHEQYLALMKYESETASEGRAAIVHARMANARKMNLEIMTFKKMQQQHRDEISETRLKQWREDKERQLIEQILRGMERARMTRERLNVLYELRLQHRRNIMTKTVRKYWNAEERKLMDKTFADTHNQKFLMEWLQTKYICCYDDLVVKRQLQNDLIESRKYHARKRQLRLEAYRQAIPELQEKRKAETKRLWEIVRKYAMRWLEKVRKRLNAPKDQNHESVWMSGTKGVLDETVKYLYQESGYERLDDFMMNILKMKKQIQAQIELEEAEEAAALAREEALAAEAAEGEDHSSAPPPAAEEAAPEPPPPEEASSEPPPEES